MRLTGLKFDTCVTTFVAPTLARKTLAQFGRIDAAEHGAIEKIRDDGDIAPDVDFVRVAARRLLGHRRCPSRALSI